MKTLVVLFAIAAVGCCSWAPLAQPPYHSAVVLDPHGRPLDTAEVIGARAIHLQAKALEGHGAQLVAPAVVAAPALVAAPAVIAAPAAVSHQSRLDVRTSPAIVSQTITAPLVSHAAYATPLLAHSAQGWAGHGHLLKKRSLGHIAYSAPIVAPSAVSHQSRVDVISSPAVVSHAVAAPLVAHAVAAPVVAVAPAAVSHQSRVDVRTSPAVVAHAAISPLAHSVVAPWSLSSWAGHNNLVHGHLLKKRSVAQYLTPVVHTIPSAVSHQSRLDVISEPAVVSQAVVAPVVAHAAPLAIARVAPAIVAAPAAVSHQARLDVISSGAHVAPLAHSAVWNAPLALSHSGLLKASLW